MFTCPVCKKTYTDRPPMYMGDICSDECFDRSFWEKALDDEAIIVNGTCYHTGPEDASDLFRGFGGRRFVFKMNDGRIIETTNLWEQGKIPEEYKREDNARMID